MNARIKTLALLGDRLKEFGQTPETRAVIRRAAAENSWFLPEEIVQAVDILRHELLDAPKLEQWAASCPLNPHPKTVLIIMAGNIPLVGFFDLLCVVAGGHACRIKPSSKDTVLMSYIVSLLQSIDPTLPIATWDGTTAPDAVIATGGDNANRYFRTTFAGIPALLRGSRHSTAVLSGRETDADLNGLEEDLFSYSGLGCRNVSLLFLPRGTMPALRCTARNPKYRRNYQQTRALLRMRQIPFIDLDGAVMCEERSFPTALSLLHYTFYDSLAEVEAWLKEHDDELQCVVSALPLHARCVPFGRAQHPGLTDYADDIDTMRFLSTI